tara:strand:- start:3335 stop:4510 length:1176 start_codon:yes stop_codon:yes gene_type:complete
MKEFNVKKSIVKYLDGEATALEKKQLFEWVESKKNQKVFKEFLKSQQLITRNYKAIDSEAAFTDFLEKIHSDKKVLNLKSITPYIAYAAIFIGVFLSIFYFINKESPYKSSIPNNEISLQIVNGDGDHISIVEDQVVKTKAGAKLAIVKDGVLKYLPTANSTKSITYQNILRVPYGKTFKVILSDGSLVHLNSGSVLKYPSVFNKNKPREVFLEGEAFFKVSKDIHHSFLVSSKSSITRVYGTEFNVSEYLDENSTNIVLVEGSIGVKKNSGTKDKEQYRLITPSQKASLRKNAKDFEITDVDVQKYIGWKDGILIFQNDRFEDIKKTLERHYNVKITNNYHEINSLRFNGDFQNDSIEKILNTIKTHTNFSFKRKGDTILINNPKNNVMN